MKYQIAFIAFLALCLYSCSSDSSGSKEADLFEKGITTVGGKVQAISDYIEKDATIFYLVRHAEKEAGDDPELTGKGKQRAEKLAKILEAAPLSSIYSTDLKRTVSTAKPSADIKKMEVNRYNAKQQNELVDNLISHKGKQFLIVGHSNSIPDLLNLFQNKKVYNDINESEFDNFYIVKVNSKNDCKVMECKY